MKIAHCADLHIGSKFEKLKEKGELRNRDTIKALANLSEFCKEEKIHILLIAGDLFESATVKFEEVKFVKELFADMMDTHIFISPGNHDYYSIDSCYADDDWSSNVKIFTGKMEKVYIQELNTIVYGAGFRASHEEKPLFDYEELRKDASNDDYKNLTKLAVIHGELVSINESSEYNPICIEEIPEDYFSYIALGHIHTRSEVMNFGKMKYAYSGNIEGTSFKTTGKKGIYFGNISSKNEYELNKEINIEIECESDKEKNYTECSDIQFKQFSTKLFLKKRIDITECCSFNDLKNKVLDEIKEDINWKNNFYRITLIGYVSKKNLFSLNLLKEILENELYYLELLNETEYEYSYREIMNENSLRAEFVKVLSDSGSKNMNYDALKFGLMALDGKENILDY